MAFLKPPSQPLLNRIKEVAIKLAAEEGEICTIAFNTESESVAVHIDFETDEPELYTYRQACIAEALTRFVGDVLETYYNTKLYRAAVELAYPRTSLMTKREIINHMRVAYAKGVSLPVIVVSAAESFFNGLPFSAEEN